METIFSSPKRIKLLEYLFENAGSELKVREIARQLKLSPGFVSRTVSILKKEKHVEKNKINPLNPAVKATKIFFNIKKLQKIKLVKRIQQIISGCEGIGVFGSWAQGLNYKESDLDVWIKASKVKDRQILELRRFAKKQRIELNLIVLNNQRIKEMKEKDYVFYCSLANSFLLCGNEID